MSIRLPHTFTVVFALIAIMGVLSWILPTGQFDRVYSESLERELVVPNSYKQVEPNKQSYIDVVASFSKGFVEAAEIISFVLIVGGAYGVILKTGAIDNAFASLIQKMGSKSIFLIPVIMIFFSVAGTVQGFWEETLAFYLIIIPLIIRLGYDSVVGLAIVLVGAITGVLASTVNPFATGVASAIVEVSIQDGLFTRIILWIVTVSASILYVLWYAIRVKKNPEKSVVYALREDHISHFTKIKSEKIEFTSRQKLITLIFGSGILFMIYSIAVLGWWIPEITMLFLTVAMISAILSKMPEKQMWENFIQGAGSFLYAAFVIGLARAIVVVAQDGQIMDTILYYVTGMLEGYSQAFFIVLNQFIQTLIALLVPSTSGHASLTMPIMAPLADLLSVERATVITSFQVGSGLANMITPTSGVLMAALGMAKVPFANWLKFIMPLVAIQFILSALVTLYV